MSSNSYPLNEFITLQRGFDLPAKDRLEGNIPVVASTSVNGYHNQSKVKAPGVVIGRSGSIGGGQFIKDDFWPLNTTLWVKDFKGHDERYIYYLLKSIDFSGFNVGSGVPTLNRNHLSSLSVNDQGPGNEKKIAHILSTLDDKIELNRKMNQTLEEMAQALFKSWFVDFDPVHAKARCSSDDELETAAKELGISKGILELFPSEFEENELGMIPKGWKVKKIKECNLEIESGKRPKGGIVKELKIGTPSVGAESISPIGMFDFSNTKYVTNEFANNAKKGWVKELDVALYKDGGKPGQFMPRVSLYGRNYPYKSFMVNEHVFLLRSSVLGQYYLFNLVNSKRFLEQLIAKGSAKAAQPGLNQTEVNDTKFIFSSKKIIDLYNNKVEPLVSKQLENGKEIQTLQKTRDTLLPKLLSGELDVSELKLDID